MSCEVLAGGFGAGPFGSMPFGTSVPEGLIILSAEVITSNELLLTIGGAPVSLSACSETSPMNIFLWSLSILDPAKKRAPFVQHIQLDDDGALHIYFDRPLCCDFLYKLTFDQAEDAPCTSITFVGPCVSKSALQTDNRDDDGYLRDIANPFLPRDAVQTGSLMALGTYEITSDGDIAQDFGERSLRKRILRRATTLAGEFFHLGNYGAGLESKRLVKPDLLRRYQEKLKAQVEREPEVRSASVKISQVVGNPNVVAVYIKAHPMAGDPIEINTTIDIP